MTLPTIHLNGTSAGELYRQWARVANALFDAMAAMAEAAPNGRDYYPQGDGVAGKAISEHEDRIRILHSLRVQAQAMCEHITVKGRL